MKTSSASVIKLDVYKSEGLSLVTVLGKLLLAKQACLTKK